MWILIKKDKKASQREGYEFFLLYLGIFIRYK